jgi:putative tryptophan/tyrosine transport system substrate-binding protein
MKRREFITLVGGAAGWPVVARAQLKLRTVGVLMGGPAKDAEQAALVATFVKELAKLGWNDGQEIRIDYHWGDGDPNRVKEQGMQLAASNPDVIFGQGTPVTQALQRAKGAAPIVFVNVSDPVGIGMVSSLARPGGSLTGFTNYESSMAGKWLEILKEIAPALKRVLAIYNPDNPAGVLHVQLIEANAGGSNIEIVRGAARTSEEMRQHIDRFGPNKSSGLMAMPDFLAVANRDLIIERANRNKSPTMFPFRYFVTSGGLAAYAVDQTDIFQRAAGYVDRILRGAQPRDLPVQAPNKFELVINLKTAQALDLTIPPTLLARADEVIE